MTTHARPLQVSPTPAGRTMLREAGQLHLLTWPALRSDGVDAAVTTRVGGVSSGPYATLNLSLSVGDDTASVLENRHRLAASLDARPDDFVFARQVHGAGVAVVGEADRGRGAFSLDDAIGDADALVTTVPGIVLAILAADCVPLVLHDPVAGVLACVHAGWRGTAAGVPAAALAVMQDLGSRPANVIAGIGPAIAPARYQVGPDVHQAITAAFGPAAARLLHPAPQAQAQAQAPQPPAPQAQAPQPPAPHDPAAPGRWLLDLPAANRLALRRAGVPASHIHLTNLATGPAGGYFFSDRAARPCGRHALVARLRERHGHE